MPTQSGVDPDRECEKRDLPAGSCSDDGVCNGEARCQYGCERPGYLCREGRCASPCVSSVDCVVDYRCNAAGECVKADERGISLPDEGICSRCGAGDRRAKYHHRPWSYWRSSEWDSSGCGRAEGAARGLRGPSPPSQELPSAHFDSPRASANVRSACSALSSWSSRASTSTKSRASKRAKRGSSFASAPGR